MISLLAIHVDSIYMFINALERVTGTIVLGYYCLHGQGYLAYFAGRAFVNENKYHPLVPIKTLEGFIAALLRIFTGVVSFIVGTSGGWASMQV